jgi:guanine deaminase
MTHEDYMLCAFDEAFKGMRSNKGGPFGSVIVSDGIVIGKGHNMVTSTNDPTAHAEIVAIRNACRAVAAFHLPYAVLYTSCEPCPMCLAAIYWANIKAVYYCADRIYSLKLGLRYLSALGGKSAIVNQASSSRRDDMKIQCQE